MVMVPVRIKIVCRLVELVTKLLKRYRMNVPPVTSVDEWTSVETGVGAAIAAGSHLEKGICALLVIAATKMPVHCKGECSVFIVLCRMSQSPVFNVLAIAISKNVSPSRFTRIVSVPALSERGLL